jgi:hypothetical protein
MDDSGLAIGEHSQCGHRCKTTAVCRPERKDLYAKDNGGEEKEKRCPLSAVSTRHGFSPLEKLVGTTKSVSAAESLIDYAGPVRLTFPSKRDSLFERMVERLSGL